MFFLLLCLLFLLLLMPDYRAQLSQSWQHTVDRMANSFEEENGTDSSIPIQEPQQEVQNIVPPVQTNILPISTTTSTRVQDTPGLNSSHQRFMLSEPPARVRFNASNLNLSGHEAGALHAIRNNNELQLQYHLRKLNRPDFKRLVYNTDFIDQLIYKDNPKLLQVVLSLFEENNEKHYFLGDLKIDGRHNIFQLSIIQGNFSTFSYILQLQIYSILHSTTEDRNNILHLAAYYGISFVVATLLQEGCVKKHELMMLINARNSNLEQPLHIAAQQGRSEILKLLIAKNAPLECKTVDGLTPILCAAKTRKLGEVKILAEHGANVNAVGINKKVLLDYIGGSCPPDLLKLLFHCGLKLNSILCNLFGSYELEELLSSCLRYDNNGKLIYFHSIFKHDDIHTGIRNILAIKNSSHDETIKKHPTIKLFINLQYAIFQNKLSSINNYILPDLPEVSLNLKVERILTVHFSDNDNSCSFRAAIAAYTGRCTIESPNIPNVTHLIPFEDLEELKAPYETRNGIPFTNKYASIASL